MKQLDKGKLFIKQLKYTADDQEMTTQMLKRSKIETSLLVNADIFEKLANKENKWEVETLKINKKLDLLTHKHSRLNQQFDLLKGMYKTKQIEIKHK